MSDVYIQDIGTEDAIINILNEMNRQDTQWGEQDHNPHKWNSIIMEELGESAKGALQNNEGNYYEELIHTAACCIQAILTAKRIGFKP